MPSGFLNDHPLFVVLAFGLAVSLLALARLFVERSSLLRSTDRRIDRLLLFSTRMQAVTDYESLFEALGEEIRETAGYRTAWLYLMREDDPDHTDLFSVSGDKDEVITDGYTTLTIKGDEFMEWLTASSESTILEDARTDPRVNREIVEALAQIDANVADYFTQAEMLADAEKSGFDSWNEQFGRCVAALRRVELATHDILIPAGMVIWE